jgi:hypothetical protein
MKFVPQDQLPANLKAASEALMKSLLAKYGEANVRVGMHLHNAAGLFSALRTEDRAVQDYVARFISEVIADLGTALNARPEQSRRIAEILLDNSQAMSEEMVGAPEDAAALAGVAAEAQAALAKARQWN